MPEKFISFPVSDLDGNNLPTTLTNALLHATTSLTGLTNGVARRVFVLQNPSPSFTPAAAAASYTLGAVSNVGTVANGGTLFTVTSDASVRKMIVEFFWDGTAFADPQSLTFNGVTNTTPHLNLTSLVDSARVYIFDVPSGVGGAVTVNRSGGDTASIKLRYGFTPSTATIETAVSAQTSTNNATTDVSQTVGAGSTLLAGLLLEAGAGDANRTFNWTGATVDRTLVNNNPHWWAFARKSGLSAGTETITSTGSAESGSNGKTMYSIEIS